MPSTSLTDRIVDGLNQMDADARRDQSGSILTQLTDVEGEDDGLLTYDRSRLKVLATPVAAANRRLIAAGAARSGRRRRAAPRRAALAGVASAAIRPARKD